MVRGTVQSDSVGLASDKVRHESGLTSDHSPVIQTYSQGGKLQLSISEGRLLASQYRLLSTRLF